MVAPLRLSRHTTFCIHSLCKSTANANHIPTTLLLRLPSSYRAFHASPKPQILETLLTSTHALLTGIHTTTHLSWALTIPLSALLLRLSLTLPLTLLSRRAIQTRLALQPLLQAWSHQIRRQNMAKSGHMGPAIVYRDTEADMREKRGQIYSRWRCQLWKNFLPAAQLPVWLLMVETLRGMVGTRKGLLGLMLPEAVAGNVNELDAAPELAAAGIPDAGLGAEILGVKSVGEAVVPVEPSLATEGMLWFPDLMAADPLLLLPFMLSGVMFLNIYSGQQRGIPGVAMTQTRIRIMRALGVVALAAGPLTLQMPTAMLLYWISSGMLAFWQNSLIDRYLPIKSPVKPCEPKKKSLEQLSS
jgi:inner membrane protein COX18